MEKKKQWAQNLHLVSVERRKSISAKKSIALRNLSLIQIKSNKNHSRLPQLFLQYMTFFWSGQPIIWLPIHTCFLVAKTWVFTKDKIEVRHA